MRPKDIKFMEVGICSVNESMLNRAIQNSLEEKMC